MTRVVSYILSCLPHHMRREVKELYISTAILNFGAAMILIFEPIYLYQLGYSVRSIAVFFLVVYILYFLLMPLGAKFAKRFGYQRSIVVSTFAFICYYFAFYNIVHVPWLIVVAAIFYAFQKMLYWPAYHAEFARNVNSAEDGREVSGIDIVIMLVSAAAPIISGVILEYSGFAVLFTVVSVIFMVSNIPLLVQREVFVPRPFSYLDAYRQLSLPELRRKFISYLGYGEELISMVIWPIFVIVVVKDLMEVGTLVGISTLIAVLVTLYIGRTTDTYDKHRVLKLGSIVYALIWLMKILVQRPFGAFGTDMLSRLAKESVSVPLVTLTYEGAQEQHLMRRIVFFEMSLVVGKLVTLIAVIALTFWVPQEFMFMSLFIVAAGMSLLYGYHR